MNLLPVSSKRRAAMPMLAALLLWCVAVGIASQDREARGGMVPDTSLRSAHLVEILRLDSTLRLDIRYATERNFVGRPMYGQARAFLQRPAAEALVRAHRALAQFGYGILVFDGYRPWSVTKKFWDAVAPSLRKYVANPRKGSRHNRGCAVDCSLFDLVTGREVEMPTRFDDFTAAAAARALSGTKAQRDCRNLLRRAMERQGFRVNADEWWHFDFPGWERYPVLDVPFDRIP